MKTLVLQSSLIPPLGTGAKFLSDNLVVSYSPFFSNANKINNKWYVTVRKSVYLFRVFLASEKTHLFCKKRNIKRRKVCHLLFKTAWIFKLAPLARRVYIKKRNVYYRIDNKHLGIFCDAETTRTLSLKIVSAIYPILRPGDNIPLLQHTSSAIEVICRTSWPCRP